MIKYFILLAVISFQSKGIAQDVMNLFNRTQEAISANDFDAALNAFDSLQNYLGPGIISPNLNNIYVEAKSDPTSNARKFLDFEGLGNYQTGQRLIPMVEFIAIIESLASTDLEGLTNQLKVKLNTQPDTTAMAAMFHTAAYLKFKNHLTLSPIAQIEWLDTKKSLLDESLSLEPNSELYQDLAAKLVVDFPTRTNLKWIKSRFNNPEEFDDFWDRNVDESWQQFYASDRIINYIDSFRLINQWIVLHFWSYYSDYSLEELPVLSKLNEAYKTNLQPIQMLTIYDTSEDITDFMEYHNYQFPIMRMGNEDYQSLPFSGYPTTLLIHANNQYTTIPNHVDKKEAIEVLTNTILE